MNAIGNVMLTMESKMTPRQAAKQLGVHPETVRRMIKIGELPAVNVAVRSDDPTTRKYRIDPADLQEFVARRSTTTD